MRRFHRILVIAATSAALGCGSSQTTDSSVPPVDLPGTPVAVTEIRVNPEPQAPLTDGSGYTSPQRLVIRTQNEWSAAWSTIWTGHDPAPAIPGVDFTRELVVLASGTFSSACHQIAIPNAAVDAGTVQVGVVEVLAGEGCACATVNTSPVYAVRMARFDGPVAFVDARTTRACAHK